MSKITAVKGMNDILPDTSYQWLWLENIFKEWLTSYGYNNIRMPILENTALFTRSIGEVTDIVEKEMYSFTDSMNGDKLTLRPEGTAGCLRAVIEHNLLYNTTQKLWYTGQMFRHERPQKGRYRQFHQLGVEAMGFKGPNIDAEIIIMLNDLWKRLGLKNVELHINCLGNKEERLIHREALIKYFEQSLDILDEESKKRLYKNPLRILDSKNPALQELNDNAPKLLDCLSEESLAHYNSWKQLLDDSGIRYVENSRLVRGLDYYNLSVFEWISSDLGSQATVCGGGRYDPLVAELSGKENYAIGFGLGIERLLIILQELGLLPAMPSTDIYIVNQGENINSYVFGIANLLRSAGYSVIQDFSNASFKAQFKKSDGVGAKISIIIGENEVANEQVVVKYMDDKVQHIFAKNELLEQVNKFFINT